MHSQETGPCQCAGLGRAAGGQAAKQLRARGGGCGVSSHGLYDRNPARAQGVGALLVGLKPEMCRPQMVSLVGRDTETGATWAFPPTLFLSVMLDHQVILQNMKHTISYFLERVRGPPLLAMSGSGLHPAQHNMLSLCLVYDSPAAWQTHMCVCLSSV